MRIRIHLLLACISIPFISGAQNELADSLRQEIEAAAAPEKKADLYVHLAEEILGHSAEESIAAVEKALEIGREIDNDELVGRSLIWKGRALGETGEYEKAMTALDEAEAIFENTADSFYLAKLYNGKGIIFKYLNELEKAIEYQYRSATLSEALDMPHNAATTYNSIANIHSSLNDYPKAIEFYEKSIAILEKGKNERALAGSLLNLANILDEHPEKKLLMYDRAEAIAKKNSYHRVLGYLYGGKADYYEAIEENMDSVKHFYRRSIQHAQLADDPYMEAYSSLHLGIHETADDPVEAERVIRKAMESDYINSIDIYVAEANDYLSKSLQKQDRYREAYSHLDTALTHYQKAYDEDVATKVSEANAKFEASKKEARLAAQELELARQKNRQNRLVIGGVVLLALAVGIFQYIFYRQKRRKKEIELALRNELAEADRLRQMDEIKTQFFTNVSHELRTPLSLIISPLEEVLKKLKQVNLESELQLAHRNSRQLLGLVNEVLDLSKMEAGKMEVEKTEVELLPLLRRVFFSFQSAADIKNVRLDFRFDIPEHFLLKTDVPKLEKVLNNLISNALKFSPNHSSIQMWVDFETVESELEIDFSPPEKIEIMVTDEGKGIHPDDLPHVFDRFFQSKKNGQAEGGTGIGLALAKQFAQLIGGELTVESPLPASLKGGEIGSRFTLSLPTAFLRKKQAEENENPIAVANERMEELAEKTTYQSMLINGQKPRVLIVEDNPEMAEYLKNNLSKNYDCTLAPDGAAALKHLTNSPPYWGAGGGFHLITSDVMMPNMDGFTLREKLNEREEWRKIPFILLTARTLETDKLKGFQLGIDDYVTKPFSLPELEARIHSLLKNKQLRDEEADSPAVEESLPPEQQLLLNAEKLVLEKMDDPQFTVEIMAKKLGYSQRQLARVFKKATGLTPVKFILEMRLQKARRLLELRQFATVNEVRYEVGIESASYFTAKFTERFGKNPKAYLEVA